MEYASPTYHKITSYDRRAMEPHAMDWRHQPAFYKVYEGVETVGLTDSESLYAKSLEAVCLSKDQGTFNGVINPTDLSKILLLAGGLTGRQHQAGQDFYYRSSPSAGALYPNEIYFAWMAGAGLESGIYHFGVHNRRLSLLRPGNFQKIMKSATNDASPDLSAVFMITAIFFRSAWKYRKRAYRYVLMDAGHLMENLRLALNAAGIASTLTYDMDDAALDGLLGVDTAREGILGCVSVYGRASGNDVVEPKTVAALPESIRVASRVSDAEIFYPEITGIHEAGRNIKGDFSNEAPGMPSGGVHDRSVHRIIGISGSPYKALDTILSGSSPGSDAAMMAGLGVMPESWQPLEARPLDAGGGNGVDHGAGMQPVMDYVKAVIRRRSRRNFTDLPMHRVELFYMLDLLCRAVKEPETGRDRAYASSVVTGFLAGNVDGVESGFYLLDSDRQCFGRVAAGVMTPQMSRVCLDQEWLARAAVHFLFMSRLPDLDARWGARGYRYAMMTAGRLGQVVYLGATALWLGCCGIGALYDHEARDLLGLSPESALLYLVAAGPVKGFDRHA
jgi:SagB-type dehydrogenase family enzyme